MYGYIYLTTNLINGKKYIGKHKSTAFDIRYKSSGVALNNAIKKYGRENFTTELIESFNSKEELNEAEIKYIKKYNAVYDSNYYNIANGGEGGDTFSNLSDSDKLKFAKHSSDSWNNNYAERCKNISMSLKGKCKSNEHKLNISKGCIEKGSNKGVNNGMYGKKRSGELAPNFGKHYYNNGVKEYLLYDIDYENKYKQKGFIKGRLQSRLAQLHKNQSQRLKGNTYNKGKIRIHKDNIEKCIKPEELETYLLEGWSKGRKANKLVKL